jgi:CPA2 family monovalent cation:H+ antiporter-2
MILVLFSIGLEFSLRRLVEIGPRPAFIAAFQGGFMLWLGFLTGRLLGLDWRSSLFVGGIVSISSTVLIQRVFHEAGVEKPLREMVLGVLVYEDIVGILFIAGLTTLTLGGQVDGTAIVVTGGKLLLFLRSSS